jgi:hypothetical protein
MTRIWNKVRYVRIEAIKNKLQARQQRTERKNFLRYLRGTLYVDLAARVHAIRINPRLTGEQKREQFKRVLDDYTRLVTAEATPVAHVGDLAVRSGDAALSGTVEGSDSAAGNGGGPTDGVRELAHDDGVGTAA